MHEHITNETTAAATAWGLVLPTPTVAAAVAATTTGNREWTQWRERYSQADTGEYSSDIYRQTKTDRHIDLGRQNDYINALKAKRQETKRDSRREHHVLVFFDESDNGERIWISNRIDFDDCRRLSTAPRTHVRQQQEVSTQ